LLSPGEFFWVFGVLGPGWRVDGAVQLTSASALGAHEARMKPKTTTQRKFWRPSWSPRRASGAAEPLSAASGSVQSGTVGAKAFAVSNVSFLHEAPVSVLRETPVALLEVLALLGHGMAGDATVAVVDSELTESTPLAHRADLVAVIADAEGVTRRVVVVEVQRQRDDAKPRAWLLCVAQLTKHYEVPVTLLVIAFDPDVARWAAMPRALGPCAVLAPTVLAPGALPPVRSGDDAIAHPQRSMLTILARLENRAWETLSAAEQEEVLLICMAFARSETPLLNETYLALIERSDAGLRATLKDLLESQDMQLREIVVNAWKDEGRAEGKAEGKVEGKAETLLHLLKRRGFAVDAALEQRVQAASVAELDRWLDRVLDAPRLEDVLDA
jgi:hypothetical protein